MMKMNKFADNLTEFLKQNSEVWEDSIGVCPDILFIPLQLMVELAYKTSGEGLLYDENYWDNVFAYMVNYEEPAEWAYLLFHDPLTVLHVLSEYAVNLDMKMGRIK
jgi:hypothetical protein